MKSTIFLKTTLLISGVIGIGVGLSLLIVPVAVYSAVNENVGGMVNLLSDLRATGGSLLACGLLIVAGAYLPKLSFVSAILATLLFLSYGLARIFGMAIDGRPADMLIYVTIVEIAVGLTCAFVLFKCFRGAE